MSDIVSEFEAFLGESLEETGRRDTSDFDPTWVPETDKVLIGRYSGSRGPVGKFSKMVHRFTDAQVGNDPASMQSVGNIEAWGSTVLDERLSDYQKGDRVMVIFEGVASGSNAKIFRSYRAKGVQA